MKFIKPYKDDIKSPFFFDEEGGLSYDDKAEESGDPYVGVLVKSKTKIAELLTDKFESYSEGWKNGSKISENKTYKYLANCISNWKMIKGINKFYDDIEYFYWRAVNVEGVKMFDDESRYEEYYICEFVFKDGKGKFDYY